MQEDPRPQKANKTPSHVLVSGIVLAVIAMFTDEHNNPHHISILIAIPPAIKSSAELP